MNGAEAAASSSQRRIGKVSQAEQLSLPTPQTQLFASVPRWTTSGSVVSENQVEEEAEDQHTRRRPCR